MAVYNGFVSYYPDPHKGLHFECHGWIPRANKEGAWLRKHLSLERRQTKVFYLPSVCPVPFHLFAKIMLATSPSQRLAIQCHLNSHFSTLTRENDLEVCKFQLMCDLYPDVVQQMTYFMKNCPEWKSTRNSKSSQSRTYSVTENSDDDVSIC